MTKNEKDKLVDNATHAAGRQFKDAGLEITPDDLYKINDFFTAFLAGKVIGVA